MSIRYKIVEIKTNDDDSMNIKATYLDDPKYSMFLFEFRDVIFKVEDDAGIGVWFDCIPQYISDAPLTLSDVDVEDLKKAGQNLLHEFISHMWMLAEMDVGVDTILEKISNGEPVDIDEIMLYNQQNN